jgi:hypothetical protein
MQGTSGVTGAAPIWAAFMESAVPYLTENSPSAFTRPADVEDHAICAISGTEPSEDCPKEKTEIFAKDQPPLDKTHDLWQDVKVDTWTNLLASTECGKDFTGTRLTMNVTDKWAQKWLKEDAQGKAWAKSIGFSDDIVFTPQRECKSTDPRPTLRFVNLKEGEIIRSDPLDLFAVVNAPDTVTGYHLEYGNGADPSKWIEILPKTGSGSASQQKLTSWDISRLGQGEITLRLTMEGDHNNFARITIHLIIDVPSPTITPTPTEIPTATSTITPTETPVPSETPTVPSTDTSTPLPTDTPTEAPTETPTEAPTATT